MELENYKRPQAISYSKKQECFHSEPLNDYIEANHAGLFNEIFNTDFRMIGLAHNHEQEERIVNNFKARITKAKLDMLAKW